MKDIYLKIFAGSAYVAMVVVNFLANGLPINNRSTGEISADYPNLFAPSGVTFSIWGLIYLFLGGYVLYQFMKSDKSREGLFKKINPLFITSSLANILWVFSWHYDYIGLSVFIIGILLYSLIKIANIIQLEQFSRAEILFIKTPFSMYFGWITVATIANITVFLVSIDWNGFGITDFIWTNIILFIGALIGIARMNKDKNVIYGLVLIWAYLGILLKHLSIAGFNGQYQSIIIVVTLCLCSFGFFIGRLLIKKIN